MAPYRNILVCQIFVAVGLQLKKNCSIMCMQSYETHWAWVRCFEGAIPNHEAHGAISFSCVTRHCSCMSQFIIFFEKSVVNNTFFEQFENNMV